MIIRVICQNMVTVESKKCKVFGLWIFVSAVILHMFRATAHTLPEPNRDPLWIWYFYCYFFFDFQSFPDCWGVFFVEYTWLPDCLFITGAGNPQIEPYRSTREIWGSSFEKPSSWFERGGWRSSRSSFDANGEGSQAIDLGGGMVKQNPFLDTWNWHQFLIWCGTCNLSFLLPNRLDRFKEDTVGLAALRFLNKQQVKSRISFRTWAHVPDVSGFCRILDRLGVGFHKRGRRHTSGSACDWAKGCWVESF